MELNEKTIREIASQLGISDNRKIDPAMIRKLENRSDAQLKADIRKLKEQLKANNISYEQQMAVIRQLMPMMDAKQQERLRMVAELLR